MTFFLKFDSQNFSVECNDVLQAINTTGSGLRLAVPPNKIHTHQTLKYLDNPKVYAHTLLILA